MKRYFSFVIVLGFFLMAGITNGYALDCTGSCDDNNACTLDYCDTVTGNCIHFPLSPDDHNACTTDTCDPITGIFTHTPRVCDDNNACTVGTCNPATGECVFTPKNCADNLDCTIDTCNPATGCVHTSTNGDPACTGDVVAWLAAHPTISNAIVWEDPIAGPLNYSSWTTARRNAFVTAFQTAWNGGSYGLTDPPANIVNFGDNDYVITVLAEGDAWSLFISYVANSLALEMGRRVPWSLLDYSDQELAIFFDSREIFHWNTTYQGYKIYYSSVPAPPDFTYSFLENNVTIAPNRLTTIAGLLDWSRNNLLHFAGDYQAANMEHYWQYRGNPPVSRVISTHYTAGCSGTVGFLRDVLRAVNVPVTPVSCGYHACEYFPSEGMYLSHGDDPYDGLSKSTPPSPPVEMLIDQAKWDAWFGPDMTYEQQNINVGRRSAELGIEYLANYLLGHYCDDLSKGLSHADGSVYYSLETLYSLADLEARNLWGRMDAKMIPTITEITPLSGQVGSYVYVNGTNFCKDQCRTSNPTETTVSLNGMNIMPLWLDKTFLYFQVPAGATTGNITITTPVWDPSDNRCRSHVVSTQVFTVRDIGNCLNKNCDDGNMCTIDSCDPATGNCTHTPNVWICDDGNACTTDSCDPATGNCSHTPVQNGTPCDDNNACTTGDVCSNGVCAGTPKNCDDGNFCTADICHADTGMCSHSNNTLSCNNGNFCTRDVCAGGVCVGTPKNCDDGNACTIDTCDLATDNCVHALLADGTPCDDGNACTSGDVCSNGVCAGTPIACYPDLVISSVSGPPTGVLGSSIPLSFTVCNQGQANLDASTFVVVGIYLSTDATITTTDMTFGSWGWYGLAAGACASRNPWVTLPTGIAPGTYYFGAIADVWNQIAESNETNNARAGNAIMITANPMPDLIESALTVTTSGTNLLINDRVTNQGTALAGAFDISYYLSVDAIYQATDTFLCKRSVTSLDAGASNPASGATQTSCPIPNVPAGAYYVIAVADSGNTVTESDETNNTASAPVTLISCDDNDICTADSFNPATGCVHTPIVPPQCNDNDNCTTDGCSNNTCTHVAVVCNDNNICTTDTCNPATGCVYTPVVNGTSCADNNLCNGTETCQGGICKAGTPLVCNDNNICTTDSCNPAIGCVYTPVANGTSCSDGNLCNGAETCQGGICKAGTPLVCNDNNLCTIDTCDPVKGCLYTPKCDDNNVCTTDTCNTRTGACSHTNNTLSCNDNNACTTNDKCSGGICKGTAKNCSDNNACTTDTCDTASGVCVHTPIVCNDNKSCTTDTCNPASGCVYTAVANGTVCTEVANGRCQTGTCVNIDLVPTAMTATKSGTTGVLVSETVKNQGSSNCSVGFTNTYYLSINSTYEQGTDIVLASSLNGTGTCSRTISSLSSGASSTVTTKTCYKPSGAVTGVKYYILVRDDSGNAVSESDETNNVKSTLATISW